MHVSVMFVLPVLLLGTCSANSDSESRNTSTSPHLLPSFLLLVNTHSYMLPSTMSIRLYNAYLFNRRARTSKTSTNC